jgi:hypothetical protein
MRVAGVLTLLGILAMMLFLKARRPEMISAKTGGAA